MQVCDIVCNKTLKQKVKTLYYNWRAKKIVAVRAQRAADGSDKTQIKLSLRCHYETVIGFVEEAVAAFNWDQTENPTIRKTFDKLGQNPRYHGGDDEFVDHLEELKKSTPYKRDEKAGTALKEKIESILLHNQSSTPLDDTFGVVQNYTSS